MLPHWKLVLAVVAVIVVVASAAVGWDLTNYQPTMTPSPSLPANSPEPTVAPTTPTAASPSGTPPVPTLIQTLTPSPTTASTSSPSPTASTSAPAVTPTSSPTPTFAPSKTVGDGLELTVSLEKTIYDHGEPVNVTLSITNITNQTINFTHTGMDFDFIVYNETYSRIYDWSIGRAFAQFIMIDPLLPGGNVSETLVWPQTGNTSSVANGALVSPGEYFIVGETNSRYGLQTDPLEITILG